MNISEKIEIRACEAVLRNRFEVNYPVMKNAYLFARNCYYSEGLNPETYLQILKSFMTIIDEFRYLQRVLYRKPSLTSQLDLFEEK